jgi:SAM-dependent methyltransferase
MSQELIWSYFQTQTPGIFRGSAFRLRFLARYLKSGQRALNVGIGAGLFEKFARERGADVYSLDPSRESLQHHVESFAGSLVAGRLESLPFKNDVFDAVIVSEVIEHLSPEAAGRALQEIRRILVPGGRIIGTVPCEENLVDGTVVCPGCGLVFHKVGHLQSFSAESMLSLLRTAFPEPKCFVRAFMAKATVGWKEYIVDLIRNALVTTGVLTREKHVVFLASKAV